MCKATVGYFNSLADFSRLQTPTLAKYIAENLAYTKFLNINPNLPKGGTFRSPFYESTFYS